ncbi:MULTISPECIES: GatB/YqeY domain-containing protein [unclassified Paracoccus (in: a-proteobacteria)]|uniref:GatB/YqeY domain-containing protein n=1 Tax=unclassified Paracoccus (in: a-proteobacteria) TaxID=2688777 RepID=UPI0012B28F29|nr:MULTISPECIES: GatB/YqeY domain-containing protein [unclassified Paracoccus (in: a-proteobacteria)]UXU73625.1 GatB/YqeY domain-containing protein [Paracoccus sp. SMMA_5]UXU79513.1 GatB/YqeY domain-containing protein [Paracoccus sp. SMMA_5_TC]
MGDNRPGLRERILADTKEAMKAKETARLSTLRLISAAIKDREIAARAESGEDRGLTEDDLIAILSRMVKQRQESARAYEEGGRLELAEREQEEIRIIQNYLPRQLDGDEIVAAVDRAIAALGADSIRDMGRVMAELRSRYAGQMDFGAVGPLVRERLMK